MAFFSTRSSKKKFLGLAEFLARFNEDYFKKNFKKIPKKCRLVPSKFHEILRKNSADFDKFSPKNAKADNI